MPEYWIVDLDGRLVERWCPGDPSLRSGQALSETLVWQPSESASPFELDLAVFFAEVLDR